MKNKKDNMAPMRFDPVTGAPIMENTGYYKTTQPEKDNKVKMFLKGNKTMYILCAVVAVVLVLGIGFGSGAFLSNNSKILKAAYKTLDESNLLDSMGVYESLAEGKISCQAEGQVYIDKVMLGADLDYSMNCEKAKYSITGNVTAGGNTIDVNAYVDEKEALLQVPFVSENIFKYSFEDYNITGFLANEIGEDDIQEINQTVNGVFALSKKAPTFNKKIKKLVLKHYNKLKFKKTDSKSMTIDGKSRKCKGYMVEITDDDARDFILDVQEAYNEYYKETVGSNAYFKEYNLDEEFQELIQMCNKIGNVNTLDVCIYLYKGKLAAISSKDMALSLYFQGGGKRMTNMELRYEGLYDNFTIKKNGSMNGKKEIGKIICSEGKSSTQIATYGYNYKSGEFDLSVTSLLTMSGALDMKRNSIQLTIDNLNVENYNVGNGNITLKKGENVKYLRGDVFDFSQADSIEVENLLKEIQYNIESLESMFDD